MISKCHHFWLRAVTGVVESSSSTPKMNDSSLWTVCVSVCRPVGLLYSPKKYPHLLLNVQSSEVKMEALNPYSNSCHLLGVETMIMECASIPLTICITMHLYLFIYGMCNCSPYNVQVSPLLKIPYLFHDSYLSNAINKPSFSDWPLIFTSLCFS